MAKASNRLAVLNGNVTIRDVAAKAGVSVATVSRVLNHTGPVRQSTSERVLAVAEDLHYVPHAGARSLSMRSTNTIGVVLPEMHGEFFSEVIRGIDLMARQSGYHLLVSGSHSECAEMRAVLQVLRGRVDGLILMSPDLDPTKLVADLPYGLPVVMLNASVPEHPCITIDNAGGARSVVKHLYALGHRRIAFISGPDDNADAEERKRGYRDAMRDAGLPTDRSLEFAGHFTEESGYEAAEKIVARSPRPTAVFSSNDSMAIGALSALSESGVRVPADMALVGFDDIPIARFLSPPLTTVKVPIAELGRSGLRLLLDSAQQTTTKTSKLETTLIVRRSCGARSDGEEKSR